LSFLVSGKEGKAMSEILLKCPTCGAVMVREDYHLYGWYLEGKKVDGCLCEDETLKESRKYWRNLLGPKPQGNYPVK
jgi:hypothetical protein